MFLCALLVLLSSILKYRKTSCSRLFVATACYWLSYLVPAVNFCQRSAWIWRA